MADELTVTSAQWSDAESSVILAEIDGNPLFIPNDMGNRHRAAIAAWEAQGNTIAAYVATPPSVPEIISDRQFFHGLAATAVITKQEALDAVKTGTIPAALQAFVDGIQDADAKFSAEMLLSGAVEFHRSHPLVAQVGAAQGKTDAEIDDFWRMCAAL